MALNKALITVDGIEAVAGLIDDMFESKEEKAAAKLALLKLGQSAQLAQVDVNKVEAANKRLFVAGWRPFIGWVCGAAFVWAFLLSPMIETAAFYAFSWAGIEVDLTGLPDLDLSTMLPVLLGMLGLGAQRSWDKATLAR